MLLAYALDFVGFVEKTVGYLVQSIKIAPTVSRIPDQKGRKTHEHSSLSPAAIHASLSRSKSLLIFRETAIERRRLAPNADLEPDHP